MIRKVIREKSHRLPPKHYLGQISASFTACILDNQSLFTSQKTVASFISSLDWARNRNSCVVLLYCFMPDHRHILLQGQTPLANVYQAMVDFKQKSGFWLRQNLSSFRWQKDFQDHIIRCHQDLIDHLRYIADNPVRLGLVSSWHDYPFTGSLGLPLSDIIDLMCS